MRSNYVKLKKYIICGIYYILVKGNHIKNDNIDYNFLCEILTDKGLNYTDMWKYIKQYMSSSTNILLGKGIYFRNGNKVN